METKKKVKLNLENVNGNAFAIMGTFSRVAKEQGFTQEFIDSVLKEAKSGDYDHLLATIVDNTEC